jgi:hypothetical protein
MHGKYRLDGAIPGWNGRMSKVQRQPQPLMLRSVNSIDPHPHPHEMPPSATTTSLGIIIASHRRTFGSGLTAGLLVHTARGRSLSHLFQPFNI